MKRTALLLGVGDYPKESGFLNLRGPRNDVDELATVFGVSGLGGFHVLVALDVSVADMRDRVARVLAEDAEQDDCVLLYYSGHGKRGLRRGLYLAGTDSHSSNPARTMLPVQDIKTIMDESRCQCVVFILDCCFSGSAVHAWTRADEDQIRLELEGVSGEGFHLIASTSSIAVSHERETERNGKVMGAMTDLIVEGIRSGAAGAPDGTVSVATLVKYLYEKLTRQRPEYFGKGDPSSIILARNRSASERLALARIKLIDGWLQETKLYPRQHERLKHIIEVYRGGIELPDYSSLIAHLDSTSPRPETVIGLLELTSPTADRLDNLGALLGELADKLLDLTDRLGLRQGEALATLRAVSRGEAPSQKLDVVEVPEREAGDEIFELTYRDFLLQRFYKVNVEDIRHTLDTTIHLRDLFVQPIVSEVQENTVHAIEGVPDASNLRVPALEHVKAHQRSMLIGAPGTGKSTFLEWLQLQTASAQEMFLLSHQQAIPFLIKVRQLDPRLRQLDPQALGNDAELIETATGSRETLGSMPADWLFRQMKAGRVLFMVDGLDEAEIDDREHFVIPWIGRLCERFPDCSYVVSSRPINYNRHYLATLGFSECHICEFDRSQISAYVERWCTAVRVSQNWSETDAIQQGKADSGKILAGLRGQSQLNDLAGNPLMLSSICLMYYFTGGTLPNDRASIYRLGVEGLLHYWDSKRGIPTTFNLYEKLRICCELAIRMQLDGRTNYELRPIYDIAREIYGFEKGHMLLDHIRYRSGLLLETHMDLLGFAHIGFQEYLAAQAIYDGNTVGFSPADLITHYDDTRWREVIPLYCGIAPASVSGPFLSQLAEVNPSEYLSRLLHDAYFAAPEELRRDERLAGRIFHKSGVNAKG